MRLVSFVRNGRPSYGAVLVRTDPGGTPAPAPTLPVVDLGARLLAYPDLRALLAADALDAARALSVRANVDCTLGDVTLQRPIPWPEKIVCVGVNYAERNEEYRDGAEAPKYPSLFVRMPDSLVAHGAPVLRPPESGQLDYEGEIVIVVGRAGRRIPAAQARAHVAGLTLMNEGTVRDWLRHGKFNVTQGKNFVASGAVGPWIVTTDACPDFTDITLRTRVNGELRQDDNTRRMMFPFDRLIEYVSTFMLLKPGDLIATGTPTGAGARFDPPKWLVPGDTVEVEATGIGVLRNPVADEPAA
ncbi:MAG TPA: fumarylacetoacetate hydrolase family protein [Quisquiliibacterium sp.]|nr:fumarylacetoacetate hydrolase family protein [Quisquiliibacterium sp.]HPA88608.1 fumarylacetoacetate hydrolase family protein [Quisquiliibacterium sp.]HQD84802.1 fumarylacetoacetate hydrolase family protein [Quisquiliibacterium sp.]HQN11879.1 fumarylacetoacetate hydrolase family protein [Quisquiliibacterium sp.]HQP66014.1 fumarylacetoacetate hydrolase family protein [Quisquiliibacterium sp.]